CIVQVVYELAPVIADIISAHCPRTAVREARRYPSTLRVALQKRPKATQLRRNMRFGAANPSSLLLSSPLRNIFGACGVIFAYAGCWRKGLGLRGAKGR